MGAHLKKADRDERKKLALSLVEKHLEVAVVASMLGVNRRSIARWREVDPEYDKEMREARATALGRLIGSTYELAMNLPDPVTGKRPYPDKESTLAKFFMIKGNFAEYKDNWTPVVDVGTVNITLQIPKPERLDGIGQSETLLLPE